MISDSILILGSGPFGTLEKQIFEKYPHQNVHSVDLDPPMKLAKNHLVATRDLNVLTESIQPDKFDVIIATEVIEHLDSLDIFLDLCRKNSKSATRLFVSYPNLASLLCRVELLCGFQPHCVEASQIVPLAGTGWLGRQNNPTGVPVGHIRGYTRRALNDVMSKFGFALNTEMGFMTSSRYWPKHFLIGLAGTVLAEYHFKN